MKRSGWGGTGSLPVVVKYCGHVLAGEAVGRVGDQQAALAHRAVSHHLRYHNHYKFINNNSNKFINLLLINSFIRFKKNEKWAI
jgi:hypothetical protein